jgi:RHS repeat-associated protein
LNRLKNVTNWLGQIATYNYDAAGRLVALTNFNGTRITYAYDDANRLTNLENRKSDNTAIATYKLTLDANGNRTQIIQNEPLLPIVTPQTNAYSYNAQRNRLESVGTNTFGYDAEGQLSGINNNNLIFDKLHRLVQVNGSPQLAFAYDGVNQRLQATRDGSVTRYVYDAVGNVIAEANASNVILRYYVYGAGLLAMITPAGESYCYHCNAVGSTIAMTDTNQSSINLYAYDPFGKIVNRSETVPQPFAFVGQYGVMCESIGLYYMQARYYDPIVGRFISEDPIGFAGNDLNLYGYVRNNPINALDPTGKDPDFFHGVQAQYELMELWKKMFEKTIDLHVKAHEQAETLQGAQVYDRGRDVRDNFLPVLAKSLPPVQNLGLGGNSIQAELNGQQSGSQVDVRSGDSSPNSLQDINRYYPYGGGGK